MMPKRILLATDGSERSMKAAEVALRIAKLYQAQVEIIHVIPFVQGYWPGAYGVPGFESNEHNPVMDEAQEMVKKTGQQFADAGIEYHTTVKFGDPANEICTMAEETAIDLVIMGNNSLKPLTRVDLFLPDSASKKVVAHAPCPVMVIR